ncbi:MAG: VOC family protein [Propionibacteriaceae bacterium]|jgi:PhnB protein|nr:VOC family protein [Propionibacteriaceae bacterium]
MQLELFFNFDGNCREALDFYAQVFNASVENVMTYGETPADDASYQIAEADRQRIMYAGMKIGQMTAMFMDMPADQPLTVGNNIMPTLSDSDLAEVKRIFEALSVGGRVYQSLQKTFFAPCYGMVEDKYGFIWQVLQYEPMPS